MRAVRTTHAGRRPGSRLRNEAETVLVPAGRRLGWTGVPFILEAIANDPAATVYVTGSRGDPCPAGDAAFLGKPIDGDAASDYGCLPPTP